MPEYEKLAKAAKALKVFSVAAVDADANKGIAASFGVKGFPTIVATLDGKLVDTYGGERTAAGIGAWAAGVAKSQLAKKLGGGGGGEGKKSSGGGGGGKAAADGEPGGGKHVVTLTGKSFDETVGNSPALWLVEFYAPARVCRHVGGERAGRPSLTHPPPSPSLLPRRSGAATARRWRPPGPPPPPSWRPTPTCGWARWTAPRTRRSAAGSASRRARALRPAVCVGSINRSRALCRSLTHTHSPPPPPPRPQGYPTLLVFGRDKAAPAPYEGARDAASIVAYATTQAASLAPPPEFAQIFDAPGYAAACEAAGRQACVLAFLPHIADTSAAARRSALGALNRVASSPAFAGRPWGWAWAQAGDFPHLEAALGVASHPALAMASARKGAAALMRASLSEANARDFLAQLPGTRATELPAGGGALGGGGADGAPQPAAWDGKDAPQPAAVEEFDLDEL